MAELRIVMTVMYGDNFIDTSETSCGVGETPSYLCTGVCAQQNRSFKIPLSLSQQGRNQKGRLYFQICKQKPPTQAVAFSYENMLC